MSYRIVKDLVTQTYGLLREGETAPDMTADDLERYERRGYIVRSDQPDPEPVWDDPRQCPARSATKQLWVAYAKLRGYNEDRDLTRDQLVAEYGETRI